MGDIPAAVDFTLLLRRFNTLLDHRRRPDVDRVEEFLSVLPYPIANMHGLFELDMMAIFGNSVIVDLRDGFYISSLVNQLNGVTFRSLDAMLRSPWFGRPAPCLTVKCRQLRNCIDVLHNLSSNGATNCSIVILVDEKPTIFEQYSVRNLVFSKFNALPGDKRMRLTPHGGKIFQGENFYNVHIFLSERAAENSPADGPMIWSLDFAHRCFSSTGDDVFITIVPRSALSVTQNAYRAQISRYDGVLNEETATLEFHRNNKVKEKPVTHLRAVLPLTSSYESPNFAKDQLPSELRHLIDLQGQSHKYLPIFYINRLGFRNKDLVEVMESKPETTLTINYEPVSIGKLRLLVSTFYSLEQMKDLGFTEKDLDEVKGVFVDTNLYLLAVTVFVSSIHILFDTLSFKNDIHFWRNRKTMVGLSSKDLLWHCFSCTIIFFYLLDQDTSLLVLIP